MEKILKFFIKDKLFTNMLLILIFAGGILSAFMLKQEEMPSVDMDKLKRGEYTLNDVLDKTKGTSSKKSLGKYDGNDVYIMKGKYGMYINCNGKNSSISHIKKELDEVMLNDVLDVLSLLQICSNNFLSAFFPSERKNPPLQ